MNREPSWKLRLLVAIIAMTMVVLISRSMVHGTELAIPRKPRGIVINLTMHREKHMPAPKFKVAVPAIDRPAGMP